jgi:hypothetical protein
LMRVKFRKLSLVCFFFLDILIIILLFIKGPKLFASVGISHPEDGLMISFFVELPITLFIILLWQRLALKVSFPSLRQVFLHPEFIQRWVMRLFIILYLLRILMLYFRYEHSQESLISISISLISLYASVVIFEIGLQMAKDDRVWHPFGK